MRTRLRTGEIRVVDSPPAELRGGEVGMREGAKRARVGSAAAKDGEHGGRSSSPSAVVEGNGVPSSVELASVSGSDAGGDLEYIPAAEDLVEEELRAKKERQQAQSGAHGGKDVSAALEGKKFDQLNLLLDQTDLYSKFLSEQMQAIESQVGAEGDAAKSTPSKRKAGRQEDNEGFLPFMKGGQLRRYQVKGVKWLISLWQNGLNGILADQMGLGKTVQAIGFLSHLWDKKVTGPFIVIAPLSTLGNWVGEFERWTPEIPVLLYHGTQEERARLRQQKLRRDLLDMRRFPVIVTSYEICLRDCKHLQRFDYKYMVVDEGHRLKNFDCKLLRELRQFNTANKLLLTGTPLQNNLAELWSLLNFLLPDVFASLSDFEQWFDFSDVGEDGHAQEQHNRIISKLHSILKPFLLRRLKVDVELSLPMKKEMVLYPEMTPHQMKLNRELVDRTLMKSMDELARKSGRAGADIGRLKNVLMQMRKNCNHPDLITGDFDGSLQFPSADEMVEQCGKMRLFERMTQRLAKANKGKGHKVLVFSQMTRMLDLIEVYLEERGEKCCRIDGSVQWSERQESIKRFNADPSYRYFLLSTRAGGLGINLTSADTVIIYDSDWNPQQDLQAMDRCHRIGQTKPVLVFRYITANSVEEQLLRRAASKLALERLVIKKGAFLQEGEAKKTSFSIEELREILNAEARSAITTKLSAAGKKGQDISDADLDALLDRASLARNEKVEASSGKGWEVVAQASGAGLLSGVNA